MKKYRFQLSNLCWATLFLLLGQWQSVVSQNLTGPGPVPTGCGVFEKLPALTSGSNSGPLYFDRFGNSWTEHEILNLGLNITDECTAGVFKLSFSGAYSGDQRTQICTAFSYLSNEVAGTNGASGVVPIKIEFISNVNGGGAAASQFMQAECGMMKNFALWNISTRTNQLPLGFFTGLIQVDTDPDWYTGPAPTDLLDWNTNYVGKVDLYTAVLHEGMHILGIASTFGGLELSNGTVLERYTDWDRYLYQQNGNNYIKLIEPANDPDCCSRQQKNPNAPTDFSGNCADNIIFRDNASNQNFAEVSYSGLTPGSINDINNRLSHLDIKCGNGEQYVMHPGIPPSPNEHSFP